MKILAIDPGSNGAVSVIEDNYSDVYSLPQCPKEMFKLFKTLVDGASCQIVIEQVNAMKGQGVTSMFNFGKGLGVILGCVAALDYTPTFVSPQRWQRHYSTILAAKANIENKNLRRKAGKTESLRLAREMFPDLADKLKRVKDDGRADALLIARYFKDTLK
jgi:crossover junction endodeoxyribonuclease RuvC